MEITVAKQVDVRANMKKYFDMVCTGRAVMVPRKENNNIVILSEREFHEFERARKIADYIAALDLSSELYQEDQGAVRAMQQLKAMADGTEPVKQNLSKGMRGALAEYADPALRKKEKGAWERAAAKKHDTV